MLLGAIGAGGPGVRVTGANVVQIAVPFIWLGMVLAISFLETPLKFRAPGITVPLGLGIGRLVFRALAVVELALAGVLTAALALGDRTTAVIVLASLLWAVLVVQVAVLLPRLDRRARLILAGGTPLALAAAPGLCRARRDQGRAAARPRGRARHGDRVVNPAPADIADREDIYRSGGRVLPAGIRRRAPRPDLPRRRPGGPRPSHLPVMGDFWADGAAACRSVSPQRAAASCRRWPPRIELTDAHFTRWLALWTAIVEERHSGAAAELAKDPGRPDRRLDPPPPVRPVAGELRHHPDLRHPDQRLP